MKTPRARGWTGKACGVHHPAEGGVDKGGRELSFEELQPDIQRLLDYAAANQGQNQNAYMAKLTSELNVRINQLERERMDTAMGNVSHATYSQHMNIENMNQEFQK